MQTQIIICISHKEKENHLGEVNKAIGIAKILNILSPHSMDIEYVKIRIRNKIFNKFIGKIFNNKFIFNFFYKLFIRDEQNYLSQRKNLLSEHPWIISWNNRGEWIAYFLKHIYNGKHIHIGKPKYLNSNQVDYILTFAHDREYKPKNSIFLPFFMTDKYIRFIKEEKSNITNEYISLFIGGNDKKNFRWSFDDYAMIIDKLALLAQKENKSLFIATSPRTLNKHDDLIQEKIRQYNNISTKIISYHHSPNEDIYPFMIKSAYCFVTADSETMASDVVSMQKPCIILTPQNYQSTFIYPMNKHLLQVNAILAIKPFEIDDKILHYPFKKIDFNVMDFFNAQDSPL